MLISVMTRCRKSRSGKEKRKIHCPSGGYISISANATVGNTYNLTIRTQLRRSNQRVAWTVCGLIHPRKVYRDYHVRPESNRQSDNHIVFAKSAFSSCKDIYRNNGPVPLYGLAKHCKKWPCGCRADYAIVCGLERSDSCLQRRQLGRSCEWSWLAYTNPRLSSPSPQGCHQSDSKNL